MDSQIEEIKNKLNILDVVGGYVKLTKTGINYRGVCPFHSEKGPSFFVSPARQMWHCFGCGAGSSVFDFIMKIEGIEFGDALRILATKAGVELKRENPELASDRKRLYEICDLSASFFEKQLEGSDWGKKAKEYLIRGIKEETIKKWRLGYSPDTWQSLSDFLVGRGYTRDEIVRAGLAVQSDKGNNPYDRFRGRIIFPIFDLNSQVIGFGARIFKEQDKKETAKYINTPQTLLYDKSNVLYGINYAKLAVRKNNRCVLTEGYTDAIMCHQAGFDNTVAVSGTALTPLHLNLLKRYTDNLLLAFDMDLAGDTATKRGINLAESQGFNMKVINSYAEKDPADIILEDPKVWEKSVEGARTIMDYYFDSAFAKFDKQTPEGKKEIGKIILPAIKRLINKIEQSFWIQKLAAKLGVSEDAVAEELKNVKLENSSHQPQVEVKKAVIQNNNFTSGGRKKLLEDRIISLIFKDPENLNLIHESHYGLFSENIKNFIENIKKIPARIGYAEGVAGGKPEDKDSLRNAFIDFSQKDEYKDFFGIFALRSEIELENDGPEEMTLCLLQLKDIELRNKLQNLSREMKSESAKKKRRN